MIRPATAADAPALAALWNPWITDTAITFHAKLGYHHTATIPQAGYKFGRFIDLVLMQKFL